MVWLACTTAGLKISLCFSPWPCSIFYQTEMLRRATSESGSIIMLVVSQQTSHWSFYAFRAPWHLDCVLFSRLERLVEQVLTADPLPALLALADYWSRWVWIISQVPLMPGQSQVVNWIAHDKVRWAVIDWINSMAQYRYSPNFQLPNFADSVWSNYHVLLTLLIFRVYVI